MSDEIMYFEWATQYKKKHCSIKLIDYMTKIHHNSHLGKRTAIYKNSP